MKQTKKVKAKRPEYKKELPNPKHKAHPHMKFKDAMNELLNQRSYVCASQKNRYRIYAELRKMGISYVIDEISYTSEKCLWKLYNVKNRIDLYINYIRSGRLCREELLQHVSVKYHQDWYDQWNVDLVIAKTKIDEICKVVTYQEVYDLLVILCKLSNTSGQVDLDSFLKHGWITQCELRTYVKRITIGGVCLRRKIVKLISQGSNMHLHFE